MRPRTLADILRPEDNNFALVRLAMAIAVLVSHSWWLATGQGAAEPLYSWTKHSLGEHAVQVFFFLSGVVVTQSLVKSGSVLDFACARILRIFPALIVCVALTALVLGPLVTTLPWSAYLADKGVAAYVLKTVTLSTGSAPLPGVFETLPLPHYVNLSLWTLKFEVLCYGLLALFGVAWLKAERFRPVLTAALAILVAGIFVGTPKPVSSFTAADNLRYFMLFFFTGTLAFLLRDWLVLTWLALPPLGVLFVAAIGTGFAELTSALFLGYATLLFASLPMPRLRSFTNDQDYSYGIYIFACPVQQAIILLRPGIGPVELTIIALLITLPLAAWSWTLIERPAMATRKGLVAWLRKAAAPRARDHLADQSATVVPMRARPARFYYPAAVEPVAVPVRRIGYRAVRGLA